MVICGIRTQLKLNRRLTGGNVTRVTIAWQWPSDAMDKKCLTSSKPQMSCLIQPFSRVIYSVGNELLIVSLAS